MPFISAGVTATILAGTRDVVTLSGIDLVASNIVIDFNEIFVTIAGAVERRVITQILSPTSLQVNSAFSAGVAAAPASIIVRPEGVGLTQAAYNALVTSQKNFNSLLDSTTAQLAGGTANALNVTTADGKNWAEGRQITFKVDASNTGAVTIALNGNTAVPLVKPGNIALTGAELSTGAPHVGHYDKTLAKVVLLEAYGAQGRPGNDANNMPRTPVAGALNLTGAHKAQLIYKTGAGTLTTDPSATLANGWYCIIENQSGAAITLDPNAAELVNGAITISIPNGVWGILETDGTNFRFLASGSGGVSSAGREILTGSRTYFVRTDGSDSNTGLLNTAGGAFLTIQKAVKTVSTLDLSINNVAIQVADGTYDETVVISGPFIGSGTVTINGNTTTPANVVIGRTGSNGGGFLCDNGAKITLTNLRPRAGSAGNCLVCQNQGVLSFSNLSFPAVTNSHIYIDSFGIVSISGGYTVAGGASYHIFIAGPAYLFGINQTVTLIGTPAFSQRFCLVSIGALTYYGNTYVGSATGQRYEIRYNGVAQTNGATLPGSIAGTVGTGGQYV